AREAYRFLSQARHVGKVVLTMPDAWAAGPGRAQRSRTVPSCDCPR
ncbi:hypothetical protein GR254_23050, partial [Mycobacterium tuberculosis]|nr:hypothetical protein [Mycobacterium tuberculosis]